MEKVKKPRSLKQIENTKKLVERNRLKSIEIKKQKENGTYVKPERKKKVKVPELTYEDKVPELTEKKLISNTSIYNGTRIYISTLY